MSKPLGGKAYGSIPHLPTSQVKSDKVVPEGQARIATEQVRDDKDIVIVQEKLDGSCTAVAKKDGEIIPLIRAGYRADSSPYEQHHYFAKWVEKREKQFDELLKEGERVVGEWMLQTHGIKYKVESADYLFIAFDIVNNDSRRLSFFNFKDRFLFETSTGIKFIDSIILPISQIFGKAVGIDNAFELLKRSKDFEFSPYSHEGVQVIGEPEGLVYRVMREDENKEGKYEYDFLCKWVRPDKEDGKYLPGVNEDIDKPIWNFDPDKI